MNFYIQTENGNAVNHPALENNLIISFGSIPENWEPFERVEKPALSAYQVLESDEPTYQKINGIWRDVWPIREMTDAEKVAKQQEVITAFQNQRQAENWAAWTFDETLCLMVPPIPRPELDQASLEQGMRLFWCGSENTWKYSPPYPQDGTICAFDFFAWVWIPEA